VDIEGDEWKTFEKLFTQGPLPFGQLLIELHYEDVPTTFRFFDGMEKAGFRIFSRETNLAPTVLGELPVAIEYSFIHPDTFGKKDPRVASTLQAMGPYPNRENGE